MEVFIAIVSLVCSILSIILFFKVWGMCNNIAAMRKLSEQTEIKSSELVFLSITNDPEFEKTLARAIFNSFRFITRDFEVSEWNKTYEARYKYWRELCKKQGWQFPKAFEGILVYREFRDKFMNV